MSSAKINIRILEGVRKNSQGDKVIENFLIDLIYEEADHPGNWRWKDEYRKQVDKFSKEWEVDNEN
jgi:hypothetical protein